MSGGDVRQMASDPWQRSSWSDSDSTSSVSAGCSAGDQEIIRSIHFTEAKHVAESVLEMKSEDEIKGFLKRLMKNKFPDIPIG